MTEERRFDQRLVFEDVGELDNVAAMFRRDAIGVVVKNDVRDQLIAKLRAYLVHEGLDADMDASEMIGQIQHEERAGVAAAMRCLALLLTHDEPADWDEEAVDDLHARLVRWHGILTDAQAQRAARPGPRKREAKAMERLMSVVMTMTTAEAAAAAHCTHRYASKVRKVVVEWIAAGRPDDLGGKPDPFVAHVIQEAKRAEL